jgi:hypothetical protein
MSCSLTSSARVLKFSFCEQAPPHPDAKTKGKLQPIQIMGPWMAFIYKANAITVQRYVVPWCVALYGMTYQKHLKLELVKEMVIALSSSLDFAAFHADEAAADYPVGFTEVARRIESAAGNLSHDFRTL